MGQGKASSKIQGRRKLFEDALNCFWAASNFDWVTWNSLKFKSKSFMSWRNFLSPFSTFYEDFNFSQSLFRFSSDCKNVKSAEGSCKASDDSCWGSEGSCFVPKMILKCRKYFEDASNFFKVPSKFYSDRNNFNESLNFIKGTYVSFKGILELKPAVHWFKLKGECWVTQSCSFLKGLTSILESWVNVKGLIHKCSRRL